MIEVLVVDDSALVRSILTAIIDDQADMKCVGAANDPLVAREMIRRLDPHVITLDIEMPRMDGLDFLEKIMRLRPMPVVMVSTLTERGAETTMKALELGAVDFVSKPKIGISHGLQEAGREIVDKIRIASRAKVRRRSAVEQASSRRVDIRPLGSRSSSEKIIAIGASTGGTEAIRKVLLPLPHDFPAIVITQHMPAGFTSSFAKRLDSLCRVAVSEARDGERIMPGHVLIAPGGYHMTIAKSGANYVVKLGSEEPVNRHRPSVDVMMNSVAQQVGANAVGMILTGMGRDGADGLKRMRDAGALTLVQNEASCVVYGMPREAVAAGAADQVVAIDDMARKLTETVTRGGQHSHRV